MFLKGVNLGGWLVLERWLTRDLFNFYNAKSEPELYKNSSKNSKRLIEHFDTYINEGDFVYLKEKGINSVRLPISHGVFGNFNSIPSTIQYVDSVMDWARKYNFKVLLDLHTAPGGQNGWEVGGKEGDFSWHKEEKHVSDTLEVISGLAKRYKNSKNLYGIELINEPNSKIPLSFLKDFYMEGYKAVREQCDKDVAVVINDSFRPYEWTEFMIEPKFTNVVLDMHLYQCFAPHEKKMTMVEHFELTCNGWADLINTVQRNRKALCGEWSLALDEKSFEWLSQEEKRIALKDYGVAQLEVFKSLSGWFYWTYDMPYASAWNFRHCVENGLLTIE
jgi:glucan 1,3-beta-glucosidase